MTEAERLDAKKAAFFDLFELLGYDRDKAYTVAEIQEIVSAYLKSSTEA